MLNLLLAFSIILLINLIGGLAIVGTISHIENNVYSAKKTILCCVWVPMLCHTYLYFISVSYRLIFLSLSAQAIFLWLCQEYPFIKPSDPRFIVGACLTLLNHFYLTGIFMNSSSNRIIAIILSYLIIWLPALICAFSISATKEVLFFQGPANGVKKR